METKSYLAVGEESTRGTKESSTVGFIPLNDFVLPPPDYMERKRGEHRGEDTQLGETLAIRMGEKWEGLELAIPAFSEAGTTAGMIGTLFKHFFGSATSAQNSSTGQYAHMMYPVTDPWATANLGTKGLSFNMNLMEGAVQKNYPYIGGVVSKLTFTQEAGQPLVIGISAFGQKLDTVATGLSSPTYPAENLRLDFNNLTMRQGATVTRTGSAPDYTDITSDGTQVSPENITLEIEDSREGKMVLDGNSVPTKINKGIFTGKLTFTLDWEDPSSGFSSVDEFNLFLASVYTTNFLLTWDSGTAAGTGDNHSLIIDLPIANMIGGVPTIVRDGDPSVTFEYDLHFDSTTTQYLFGLLLKNTASAV